MYFYLYDTFLQNKKYKKVLASIEAKLTDLNINGSIGRLNILKNSSELIRDALKRGAETIIVLGNDITLNNALNAVLGDFFSTAKIILGIIPVGEGPQFIAYHLGIPNGEAACETISRRVKVKIDVAKINENIYFLNHLECLDYFFAIEGEGEYKITAASKQSQCFICNFKNLDLIANSFSENQSHYKKFFNPQDGIMEVLIKSLDNNSIFKKVFSKKQNTDNNLSILSFKNLKIYSLDKEKTVRLKIDSNRILKTPVSISVLPQKIEMIVGRERKF